MTTVDSDNLLFNTIKLLSVNPTKWLNRLKQFVSKLPTSCLNVFDHHFVGSALKGLRPMFRLQIN